MKSPRPSFANLATWQGFRAFSIRDFRLIWIGAFLSFTGGQIQMVAQGAYVFEITRSNSALGLVAFASMVPVTILGPFMGVLVDVLDRKKVLVTCAIVLAAATAWNAATASLGVLTFAQILVVALIGGLVQTIEPTSRQTIIREVVGEENLASAVPLQAMTFNLARVVGPALGGIISAAYGFAVCFWINTFSFGFVIVTTLLIKTPLSIGERKPQPIKDLLFEGMLYTVREKSLKTIFVMEGALSLFGVAYLFQMPAVASDLLGLDKAGLGFLYSVIGLGAITGLVTLALISHHRIKSILVRGAMATFAIALFALSLAPTVAVAIPCLALLGACTIMQFNTTNTLFQLLSPQALRGRVLSMHLWAIAGLSPIGNLLIGFLADSFDLRVALATGAVGVAAVALWGHTQRHTIVEP